MDTTAQQKNITFPTDAKLHKNIIDKSAKIAKENNIKIRRSYERTSRQLVRDTFNGTHPRRGKKASAAKKKLKTIAGRLIRELERKSPSGSNVGDLEIFKRVLAQKKTTKDKIYSLHEPEVYCMGKGKAHKRYEFGNKASVVLTQNTNIIVGAVTFKTNEHDGHTQEGVLDQIERLTGRRPKTATVDRGYKGKRKVGTTQINMPRPPLKKDTQYRKRKKRKRFKRRAVMGHLKSGHRVAGNFLKGQLGETINFVMAAAGSNYEKLMKRLKEELFWLYKKSLVKYKKAVTHKTKLKPNKPTLFKGRLFSDQ